MPFGPTFTKKFGNIKAIAVYITLLALCILLSSFTTAFVPFLAVYAVGFGFAYGFMYTAPMNICMLHFPKKKGMVSGMLLCGLATGGSVYTLFGGLLINPKNVKPFYDATDGFYYYEADVANNIVFYFRIVAGFIFFGGLIGVSLLRNPK